MLHRIPICCGCPQFRRVSPLLTPTAHGVLKQPGTFAQGLREIRVKGFAYRGEKQTYVEYVRQLAMQELALLPEPKRATELRGLVADCDRELAALEASWRIAHCPAASWPANGRFNPHHSG